MAAGTGFAIACTGDAPQAAAIAGADAAPEAAVAPVDAGVLALPGVLADLVPTAAGAVLVVRGTVTLDADDGGIDPPLAGDPPERVVVAQDGGPPLSVWRFASVSVESGGVLRFAGHGGPVLLVNGDARIAGTVDVSCAESALRIGGPGGYDGSNVLGTAGAGPRGGGFGTGLNGVFSGGAGAGGATTGGIGDPVRDDSSSPIYDGGAAGGVAARYPVESDVLAGGSGGGAGGATGTAGASGAASGGGGGGLFALLAQGSVTISGVLLASGCGGLGAYISDSAAFNYPAHAAGGGGAGGTLVVAGSQVTLALGAQLFANGGGGGGPIDLADLDASVPRSGQPGPADVAYAAGGTTATSSRPGGGRGGYRDAPPTTFATPADCGATKCGSAGGGGAAGAIYIGARTPDAVTTDPVVKYSPNVLSFTLVHR